MEKSQFFLKEIQYFGFKFSTKEIQAIPEKVAAIGNFPKPKNQKLLKVFLRLVNLYNIFSMNYTKSTQLSIVWCLEKF